MTKDAPNMSPLETELPLWKPPAPRDGAGKDDLAVLRGVPLFGGLGNGDLRRIMKLLHVRQFEAGEVVFREGQTGAGMYIIQEGEVEIVTRLADGTEKSLVTLTENRFFGELALLEAAPRSATAVVRRKTTLLGIFQPDLEALMERDGRLGARVVWNLARVVSGRLRDLSNSIKRAPAAAPPPSGPTISYPALPVVAPPKDGA